jgi:hypothetical protein
MTPAEQLAEYCHEMWSGWMKALFSMGEMVDGSFVLSQDQVRRFTRLMYTSFFDLSKDDREGPLNEAVELIRLFPAIMEDMGLYVITIGAFREENEEETVFQHTAVLTNAENDRQAVAIGLAIANKEFPVSEGWTFDAYPVPVTRETSTDTKKWIKD